LAFLKNMEIIQFSLSREGETEKKLGLQNLGTQRY